MCVYIDRGRGEEEARKTSILPVVGGARTQFASNYEETDTTAATLSSALPPRSSPEAAALTPDGAPRLRPLARDAPQPRLTRLAETRTPNQIFRRAF